MILIFGFLGCEDSDSNNTYLDSQKPEDQINIPETPKPVVNNTPPETQDLLNQLPTDLGSGNQFLNNLQPPR